METNDPRSIGKGKEERPSRLQYFIKAVLFCIVFIGSFIAFSFIKSFFPQHSERLIHGITGTLVAFLITYLFLRWDKGSFKGIGLNLEAATAKRFFIGFFIGIGLMGLMTMGVIYFSGFTIEVNPDSDPLNFLFLTIPLIPLAFMEELAFRGYTLSILKEGFGVRLSIIISSVLFGLAHIAYGWTIENALLGAGVWGMIYGLAAVYSKGISMPTGIHYAANLTTSSFGVSAGSFNIWVLKQENGGSLENYQADHLTELIPKLGLLAFAIFCIEWYLKKAWKIE